MTKQEPKKSKISLAFSMFFLVFSLAFIVSLFVFKNRLTAYSSKLIQQQTTGETKNKVENNIQKQFNYIKNGQQYETTFLEFGALNCAACKRMEKVLEEITANYSDKVNVLFINVTLPENVDFAKYYGISAIPTQILLNKTGKEFFRHTGFLSAYDLEKELLKNTINSE